MAVSHWFDEDLKPYGHCGKGGGVPSRQIHTHMCMPTSTAAAILHATFMCLLLALGC